MRLAPRIISGITWFGANIECFCVVWRPLMKSLLKMLSWVVTFCLNALTNAAGAKVVISDWYDNFFFWQKTTTNAKPSWTESHISGTTLSVVFVHHNVCLRLQACCNCVLVLTLTRWKCPAMQHSWEKLDCRGSVNWCDVMQIILLFVI